MKIYLVGMPGSGKTTLGKRLANQLLLPFIDLDSEIELRERMSIPDIFSSKGEDYFRSIESATLAEFASGSATFVMATGGGAPCFFSGMDVMNGSGLTVYLKVGIETLIERTQRNKNRPLLANQDIEGLRHRLVELASRRNAIYERATIIIEEPTLEKVLERLAPRK